MNFDYIIVGAGAAGSVVARRLVDAGFTVLLLEAGEQARHPFFHIPAGFFKLLQSGRADWGYEIEAQPGLGGRNFAYPRGKVMGGSGAINGLMQSWGLPYDFDRWAAEGCSGWSFADVKRFFMKSEAYAPGDPGARGRSGPIEVADFTDTHPLTREFLAAGAELGLPFLADYNSDFREGLALVQQTRRGRFRETSATAYLKPIHGHPRLNLQTSALVDSIVLEEGHAKGVNYRVGGEKRTALASKEVVLCAGALNTPHLLHLSGIGDGAELQAAGIRVRHHLPGVGRGLQDHFIAKAVRGTQGVTTLNQQARGVRLVGEAMRYVMSGKGPLTYSFACGTGYLKSSLADDVPDLQISYAPGNFPPGGGFELTPRGGVTLGVWIMRPESRGYVRTVSADPAIKPRVSPGYLQAEGDQRRAIDAVRWARRLLFSKSFDRYGTEEEMPGRVVASDEDVLDYARRTGSTTYHPCGSCRMGVDDQAVVDPQLRVHGIRGLRIADASIMPHITSSNTHAPTVMIAEKAAELMARA